MDERRGAPVRGPGAADQSPPPCPGHAGPDGARRRSPRLAYSGPAAGIDGALSHGTPAAAPSDLGPALTLGASLLTGPRPIVVARAPEDPAAAGAARRGELSSVVVGSALADQGIFSPTARCGIGTPDRL